MAKKIMILGAGILQLPAIEKAINMGLSVVALDMDPDAVGFSVKGVIKEVVSTTDIPAALDAAKRHKIDGVMTLATDMPMRTVAAIANELNLVGISEQTALNATDKSVMRQCLLSSGVPIPKFLKATNEAEYEKAVSNFNNSFIVKPCDSSGSRGVSLIKDKTSPLSITNAFNRAISFSNSGGVMIEEYMRGPEVSVEALTVNGKTHIVQITDKITTGAPYFVELGHTQPSRLPEKAISDIEHVAKAAISAIGIENGPSHTEIIVTDEGAKIVEIGARLGGDCITTHLVPLSTGVDMVKACINIALGNTPDITRKFNKGSAIRYFEQTAGTVKSISGMELAENCIGVKQVSIVHGEGNKVTEIESSGSRMGFVIAEGENADIAECNCQNAIKKIEIVID